MKYKKIVAVVLPLFLITAAHAQTTVLNASGKEDSYSHIQNILGENALKDSGDFDEENDCKNDTAEFKHIQEVFDEDLDKFVFEITSHADDLDCRTKKDNKARSEIKVDGASAEHLKITKENEQTQWSFLIKIPDNFQPTDSYTHFIQAKGEQEDKEDKEDKDSSPRFRLSLYQRSKGQVLELNYSGDNGGFEKLIKDGIPVLKGQWIEVFFDVLWANQGQLKFTLVNHQTGELIHSYDNKSKDLWNEEWVYMRPKFGIYREGEDKSMQDVSVRFSDIKFTKGDDIGYIKSDLSLHLPSLHFKDQSLWAELKMNPESDTIEWELDSFGFNSLINNQASFVDVDAESNINIPLITDGKRNYSATLKFSGQRGAQFFWQLEKFSVIE